LQGNNYEQLSTNTGSTSNANLNSTGQNNFNYSSATKNNQIGSSRKLPAIGEKNNSLAASSGRPPRRALIGGPLEIVDHQRAAKKLKSILGKCEEAALTS
jgi:hypothetical protein